MAVIYESVSPIIPNTTMEKYYINDVHKGYRIRPNVGYVMHDQLCDYSEPQEVVDEITGEIRYEEIPVLGYTPAQCTVAANYDFAPAEMLDEAGNTVTAYGYRQFFCKPETDVPADQIFGATTPPAEIM